MSSLSIAGAGSPGVIIKDEAVYIRDLVINNAELAAYLGEFEDASIALESVLEFAMTVRRLASSTAEIEALESAASRVQESLEELSEQTVEEITEFIQSQTDVDDPESLAKVLVGIMQTEIQKALDPSVEDSLTNKFYKPLTETLDRVNEAIGKKSAVDNSNAKGTNFNKRMDGILQGIATACQDSAEYTNDVESETGDKVGDEVITIFNNDRTAALARVVWEFKAEKGVSQNAALKELNQALVNRDASAGVFVLARDASNANWPTHATFSGNRMIIVVDKDNPDELLINYAYIWARWHAIRLFEKSGEKQISFDIARLRHVMDTIDLDINTISTIKSDHTSIETHLEEARKHLKALQEALKKRFEEIRELMTTYEQAKDE